MVDLTAASKLAGGDFQRKPNLEQQQQVSWLQSAIAYLSYIRDLLSSMADLAAGVVDGAASSDTSDAAFQLFKQDILNVIEGGRGSFESKPLFMGDAVNLSASGGVEDPSFASFVWGADSDRIREDVAVFRACTADEQAFRAANSVGDEDLLPKTHAEKKARRQRNLFDTEYGNIRNAESAQVMLVQLENGIKQIIASMSRFDTRAENIISQSKVSAKSSDVQELIETVDTETFVKKLKELRAMQLEVCR